MKKLFIVMIALALAGTVSAQRFHTGGFAYRPTVVVGGGFYPYYGIGFGFNPFYPYYPYYPYGSPYYGNMSKLQAQIQQIKVDYNDKIWSAKQDTNLTRKERRQKVRALKVERDNAINDLKRNYYKQ
jgi:hypothetical protein